MDKMYELQEGEDAVLSEALYDNLNILERFLGRIRKLNTLIRILNTVPLGDLQLVRCEDDLDEEILDDVMDGDEAVDAAGSAAAATATEPAAPGSAPTAPAAAGSSEVAELSGATDSMYI